jgi:nitroreductase
MDVYEAIEKRRTIRSFSEKVSEQRLKTLLLAGVKAPSGSNMQPWEFIIVEDMDAITQIAELKYQQTLKMFLDDMFLNNPKMIEKVYQNMFEKLSMERALRQKEAYRNCTVVAVCNQKGHGSGRKPWMNVENIASTWMCIENIMLAATAEGLGVQISILREEYKIEAEKMLSIPSDYELATMLMFGVPTSIPTSKEFRGTRDEFSWLHKNRFGNKMP